MLQSFHDVADDAAAAMFTTRREFVDGALEGVEAIGLTLEENLQHGAGIISAGVAGGHEPDSALAGRRQQAAEVVRFQKPLVGGCSARLASAMASSIQERAFSAVMLNSG